MAASERGIEFVRLLGPIQLVTSSGSIIDVPSVSQRRLLAVLALNARRSMRAQKLADAVGVSPGALRNSVGRLRRIVGEQALVTTSVGYRLDMDVDAETFCLRVEQALLDDDGRPGLERALAMWTGPALGEFESEPWALADAVRLTEVHASALEERAADLIARQRWPEAIAGLGVLVTLHPFRDRPRGLLIRALAGAGRQADALRSYQTYRTFLGDEVGTTPSADVQSIERRVAAGWNGIEAGCEERVTQHPAAIHRGRADSDQPHKPLFLPLHGALLRDVRLVGRSAELALLAVDFEQTRLSGMRSVIVAGEAGIGKSTLMGAFARRVQTSDEATVLYGRCDEGSPVPLQPFVGLIGSLVEHAPLDLLSAHTARCGGDLLPLAPHLGDRIRVSSPSHADIGTEQYMMFEAVADLLRRLADRAPVVIMLDDLHWAEPTALQLLRSLGRALVSAPVLLIAAFRDPGEPRSDELRAAIADLDRADARRLPLGVFDDAELSQLVRSAVDTGEDERDPRVVADVLRHESAGNPLYASHLLRHWIESDLIENRVEGLRFAARSRPATVPPSLREVLWSRVRSLGNKGPAILSAAAVLGVHFRVDVLTDMLDIGENEVTDVLDDAVSAGLLVESGAATGSLRFTHSLVASAAYDELRTMQRARLHERAARALQKNSDEPSPMVVVQLARHCELGGLVADAQKWALEAGDHALGELAPNEAAGWYRKALDHAIALGRPASERADLLVRLGEAQHRSGDPHALATLFEGAKLAEQCGARAALVRAALASDRGFMRLSGYAPEQLKMVEAAFDVADPADEDTYARLLALFAQCLVYTSRADERRRVALRAIDIAIASADQTLLPRVARAAIYGLWGAGANAMRAEVGARAVAIAEGSGDPFLRFGAHQSAFNLAIETGDAGAAARSLAELRSIAERVAEPRMHWIVAIIETFQATMAARFDDAERTATETFELGSQIGESDVFSVFAAQIFVIGTFAGRHADMLSLVEQSARENPDLMVFRLAFGIICTTVDRHDEARAILAEGVDQAFRHVPPDLWWMTTLIGYSIIAIEMEDASAAAMLLPLIEPSAAEVSFNGATSQGPISAYVGKLHSLLRHHEHADTYLRAALATAVSFGWHYHHATALIDLARCRYRWHGRLDAEALSWLEEAATICDEHGIRSWAARIVDLRNDTSTAIE